MSYRHIFSSHTVCLKDLKGFKGTLLPFLSLVSAESVTSVTMILDLWHKTSAKHIGGTYRRTRCCQHQYLEYEFGPVGNYLHCTEPEDQKSREKVRLAGAAQKCDDLVIVFCYFYI